MVRVVLDTNVLVSASLTSDGAAAAIVHAALSGEFTLCLSSEVLAEYREVMARPKFSMRQDQTALFLAGIVEAAIAFQPQGRITLSSDEEDNRFLECAQAAQADYLVTGNKKHLPARLGPTQIIGPREFLQMLQE